MTEDQFNCMRNNKQYRELGERFFLLFVTLKKGKERTKVSKLWESLSEEEQNLCEEV